jgi:hypothetical protein
MSQFVDGSTKTFTTAGAVSQFARVVVGSGGTITTAGATDTAIGTAENLAASGDAVSVRLRNASGTQKCIAATAITRGNVCYAAASGKVSAVANTRPYGIALETTTADGDIIEVAPFNEPALTPIVLAAANGAIAIAESTVVLTKAGVAAMTLAAPTAAQNGTRITVTSATANAHTITATGLIDDGVTGGSKTTATFAAFAGASCELMAYEGKWHTLSLKAVTVS